MKRLFSGILAAQIALMSLSTGCRPNRLPQSIEQKKLSQQERQATSEWLCLTERAPKTVLLGGAYQIEVEVEALEDLQDIILTGVLPTGLKLKEAAPKPLSEMGQLQWLFTSLKKGERVKVILKLMPLKEAHMSTSFKASAKRAKKPLVQMVVEPAAACFLGEESVSKIELTNCRSADLTDLTLSIDLGQKLLHRSGQQKLELSLPTLSGNETQEILVPVKGLARGKTDSLISLRQGDALLATKVLPLNVQERTLKLEMSGIERQFIGKKGTYAILLKNTGDTDLKGLLALLPLSEDAQVIELPEGRLEGRSIKWELDLEAGQERTIAFALTQIKDGPQSYQLSVSPIDGEPLQASIETLWLKDAVLLIERIDGQGPLSIGQHVIYQVQLKNERQKALEHIAIQLSCSDELKPLRILNEVKGRIEEQKVFLDPQDELPPNENITFEIECEVQKTGTAAIKAEVKGGRPS